MSFWDSSAVVPLVITQTASPGVEAEFGRASSLIVWWATRVECASALGRLERAREVAPDDVVRAIEGLSRLSATWLEVQPTDRLRDVAARLLRVHPLRAGDALQLAAAIVAADGDPRSLPFVTFDERLALAAEREGFPVVRPG